MQCTLRVATVLTLLVAVTACKKDLGPTDIDVQLLATVPDLVHIRLAVRDQNIDKVTGYAWAFKDIPDGSSKTNPLDRDLTQTPVVVRLTETPILKGKPILLYVEGYQIPPGASAEKLVVAGSITLEYQEHKTQHKKIVLSGDFVANDKDHDGFRACGTFTPSDDPLEQGFFSDALMCDCNDNNALINPFNFEICGDGIDNNCTGWPPDENCTDCLEDLPCSSLPPDQWSRVGVGICVVGHRKCNTVTNPDGTVSHKLADACEGEVLPGPQEILDNGKDDDCDGAIDEGSACTVGTPARDCFLGQIDPTATTLAKGVCSVGHQACTDAGTWDIQCVGEHRPQRPPRDNTEQASTPPNLWTGLGFYELIIPSVLAQCDGLDNDCDGFVDEEPSFDIDEDDYTICGTKDVPPANGIPRQHVNSNPTTDPIFLQTPDLIDCDDSNPNVNPSEHEICNNGIDDDCRCDRGDFLGHFSTADGGCGDQPYDSDQLICDQDLSHPYNENNGTIPQGKCDDAASPFYIGVSKTDVNGTQTQTCFPCRGVYGYTCDTGGTNVCGTKAHDCASCTNPNSIFNGGTGSAAAVPRPICGQPAPGSCSGVNGPSWVPVTRGDDGGPGSDLDDRDDCGAVSCTGWYAGFTDTSNLATLCYQQSDASASLVTCAGNPLVAPGQTGCQPNGNGCCEGPADVCGVSHNDTAMLATLRPPSCARWNTGAGGCSGQTAPAPIAQDGGSDLFSDCGGAPYTGSCATSYDSLQTVNVGGTNFTLCFPKADVTDTSATCDGAGACRNLATNCAANGRSANPDPNRPVCKYPTSGCSPGVAPSGYTNVAAGTDPFNDCPGDQVCDASATCKAPLGDPCSNSGQCQSGFCTDGVCCQSACGGTCQVCGAGGTCQTRAANDNTECAACNACNGSSTSCSAQADGTGYNCSSSTSYCCGGTCNTAVGTFNAACGVADCASGHWACSGTLAECSTAGNTCGICMNDQAVNGSCSRDGQTCSGSGTNCPACQKCTDSGTSASCQGSGYGAGSQDLVNPGICSSPNTCDGAGNCVQANGSSCSNNSQCASGHCVDGHCCGTASCPTCSTCGASSDGSCTTLNATTDTGCNGFCCQGTCTNNGATLGGGCGSGDCAPGATWVCSGAAGICNSSGQACGASCTNDVPQNGMSCDVNGNCTQGSLTPGTECILCVECVISSGIASCGPKYPLESQDTAGTVVANTCDDTSNNCGAGRQCACDGNGACLRKLGQSCSNSGQCASGNCSGGTCQP